MRAISMESLAAPRTPLRPIANGSETRRAVSSRELLRTLDCVAASLRSPLMPSKIAAFVGTTAMAALDAQVVAVLIDASTRRRFVRAFDAGLSGSAQRYVSSLELGSPSAL